MNIHEYQAKELYWKYGIPVPKGIACMSVEEATAAAKKLIEETGNEVVVVKAQIHAGGRGKAGGVKVVKGVNAATEAATEILGKTLVTHQTGPEGKVVQRLLVEQGLAIKSELYLALVVDRESSRIAIMASTEGGMDIEEVAASTPEKIHTITIDPAVGLQGYQIRQLAFGLGLTKQEQKNFSKLLSGLGKLFEQEDCSIAEINPLILTEDEQVIALDAKVNFDSNAEFRHRDFWKSVRDLSEEAATETEAKAKEAGLSFIQLDGNIGCLVNGAGLAMSTMDTIKYYGGEPANFLDVGGGASEEAVTKGFRIILQSEAVQGIFVNIFGGIMRCDTIANGVVAATKELGLEVPLVVRLEGTKVEEGRKILDESGLAITSAATMAEGAQKIVALAKG
ncbi:MAG: ADP-forming succinate--CoA ligase subunit beta [Deltaproteobacteria bacterium]|nr:MAG: ADP-forming succinate--CoA ligase subunit beta [Deltaproteobacteria bacterium]